MPGRKLRCPDFVVGAARIGILPRVTDIKRAGDHASADFVAEEALEHVLVNWQRVLRKDWIPQLLEFVENLVVQARIVVIRTPYHNDSNAVFALELIQHLARPAADAGFVVL